MGTQGTATTSGAGNTGGNQGGLLYYGDNLEILRRHIDDELIDLIYLDPAPVSEVELPFNSNADYNVLFLKRAASERTRRSRRSRTRGSGMRPGNQLTLTVKAACW